MQRPPRAEAIRVDGPAGRLEAVLERPQEGEPAGIAVVCHPHPLHGGSMTNKVAHMLARSFLSTGLASLRFNFRGVGQSEGEFAEGEGEVDDVLAAVAAARRLMPGSEPWLAGFSFGAAMSITAATQTASRGLVSVAPAARRFGGSLEDQPVVPWLIVHGEDDELVPVDETIDWVNSLQPGPELIVFPETGHFFHGKLVELRDTVSDFVRRVSAG